MTQGGSKLEKKQKNMKTLKLCQAHNTNPQRIEEFEKNESKQSNSQEIPSWICFHVCCPAARVSMLVAWVWGRGETGKMQVENTQNSFQGVYVYSLGLGMRARNTQNHFQGV